MALPGGQIDSPAIQQNFDALDERLSALEAFDFIGNGSPENIVTAAVGATYRNRNGGTGTTLYVKESGGGPPATNTGWIAK